MSKRETTLAITVACLSLVFSVFALIDIASTRGPRGLTGSTGMTSRGPYGPPGTLGPRGTTGPTGLTGEMIDGMQGVYGPAGPTGWSGLSGPTGVATMFDAIGDTGPKGPPGYRAESGVRGEQGPLGPSGHTFSGMQGPPSNTGLTGITGQMGPQGSQLHWDGPTGITGATGPTGSSTGSLGPVGVTGETGPKGQSKSDILFGNGTTAIDGSTGFADGGTYIFQRDMFFEDLYIANDTTLVPNGYRIFVQGKLTTDTSPNNLITAAGQYLSGPGSIGSGSTGGSVSHRNGYDLPLQSTVNTGLYMGGAGAGGSAGQVSIVPDIYSPTGTVHNALYAIQLRTLNNVALSGGSGGGSGTSGIPNGGNGGGVIMLAVREFGQPCFLSLDVSGQVGNMNAGGGGGGLIMIVTSSKLPSFLFPASEPNRAITFNIDGGGVSGTGSPGQKGEIYHLEV